MGQLRLKFLLKKAGLPAAVALYTLFHLKNKNNKNNNVISPRLSELLHFVMYRTLQPTVSTVAFGACF